MMPVVAGGIGATGAVAGPGIGAGGAGTGAGGAVMVIWAAAAGGVGAVTVSQPGAGRVPVGLCGRVVLLRVRQHREWKKFISLQSGQLYGQQARDRPGNRSTVTR